jgi:4-amino-4-deoxy-L-arabinose transferase-like glycosyltransferase
VERRTVSPLTTAIVALTVLAAALRLYGIGHQSLWFDESFTAMLVKLPLGRMLSTIPHTESTPYLYYLLAWVWTHIFGHGAADLRALSALIGVAVVPVAFLATERLIGNRRAALSVAALAAFNPLLIWYSQEARAYELLVLTSACTLLAFAYAREQPSRRRLLVWALASAVALVSHYDAALVVVPEAVWLLALDRRHVGTWLAIAFVGVCGCALLPLLIAQSNAGNAAWITNGPLNDRLGQILPQFLLGTGSRGYVELMWIAFVLAGILLVLLAGFASSIDRRLALGVGAIALAGFLIVLLVAAAGNDTILSRNLLALWLPLAMMAGAGLCHDRLWRVGAVSIALLCLIGLTATISVANTGTLERPDWAAVAKALGPWPAAGQPQGATRVLVFQRDPWLESLTAVYLPHTHALGVGDPPTLDTTEIDIVANSSPAGADTHWLCWWGAGCNLYPSKLAARYRIAGFRRVARTRVAQFTILRFVSRKPREVSQLKITRIMNDAGFTLYGKLIQRS